MEMRPVETKLAALLALASFVLGVFAAGQTYFVCRMSGEIQSQCCCAGDAGDAGDTGGRPDKLAAVSSRDDDCCEARVHAAPGAATAPAPPPALAAKLSAPRCEPVALVPRARASDDATLPDWTGPPLDRRRALISVFLL